MAVAESLKSESPTKARQNWMSLLACAKASRLDELLPQGLRPPFTYLRKPETGLVMLRARQGGTGSPFNMGEATLTRCSIRLQDGTIGHAFVMGRSHEHAVAAAICDALLQGRDSGALHAQVIGPLAEERAERELAMARKNAATKVDFFTLVRGEDE